MPACFIAGSQAKNKPARHRHRRYHPENIGLVVAAGADAAAAVAGLLMSPTEKRRH